MIPSVEFYFRLILANYAQLLKGDYGPEVRKFFVRFKVLCQRISDNHQHELNPVIRWVEFTQQLPNLSCLDPEHLLIPEEYSVHTRDVPQVTINYLKLLDKIKCPSSQTNNCPLHKFRTDSKERLIHCDHLKDHDIQGELQGAMLRGELVYLGTTNDVERSKPKTKSGGSSRRKNNRSKQLKPPPNPMLCDFIQMKLNLRS